MHVGLLVVERDTREVCLEIKAEELQANLPIWSPVTIIAPSSADRDKIYLKEKESERRGDETEPLTTFGTSFITLLFLLKICS